MPTNQVYVSLDAVIVTVSANEPNILVVDRSDGQPPILPSGPLDADEDETLELAVRRWLSLQTGITVSYVEQLYTFGDRRRGAAGGGERQLAVGYIALVPEETPSEGSLWVGTYELFPWEDRRFGRRDVLLNDLAPRLTEWARGDALREGRVQITFGLGAPWDPIRVLERYELLYEAGLVEEQSTDEGGPAPQTSFGRPLGVDHRRIVATALGRLRGKLTYRPVIFEVMPDTFTLTELQRSVEALLGMELHKQNFRRIVDRGELVEATGGHRSSTGGRPAGLYRFRSEVASERPQPGFPLPRPKAL